MKMAAVLGLAFCFVACAPKGDVVPAEPDYSDTTQWYIADRGNIMPPKTTWFEPKLRSGLVIHELC